MHANLSQNDKSSNKNEWMNKMIEETVRNKHQFSFDSLLFSRVLLSVGKSIV